MGRPRRSTFRRAFAALVYGVGMVFIVMINRLDPSPSYGWLSDSAVTLSAMGLHISLVAGLYSFLERRAAMRVVLIGASIAAALLGSLLTIFAIRVLLRDLEPMPTLLQLTVNGALNGLLLLGFYIFTIRHPDLLEETRALRTEAELSALRARFEPHFLLNALNAIAGLVKERPDAARRTLAALGDLLQEALRHDAEREHTVASEIAWLRSYVAVIAARYDDALSASFHVNPRAEPRRIPRLIVQPLVENAVIHGIAASLPGRLDLTFDVDADDRLIIRIDNSGPAVSLDAVRVGNGLALVQRRLALEARGATFVLAPSGAGTSAELRFPVQHMTPR